MRTLATFVVAALFVAAPNLAAAPAVAQETPYQLDSGSTYSAGCFAPCLCPVNVQPMKGTFRLQYTGADPFYSHYDVLDVAWSVPGLSPSLAITGSGTYVVGGEFAAQHRMMLDLSIGGGAPIRFDSGLVLGGGTFPAIDIKVSLHRETCRDTVLHVVATPTTATSAEGIPGFTDGIRPGGANPFRGDAPLFVNLAGPARVEVAIFDLQGRSVRRLAAGRWMPAGTSRLVWDGRSDSGQATRGGLYFARATIAGKRYVAKVIRIP